MNYPSLFSHHVTLEKRSDESLKSPLRCPRRLDFMEGEIVLLGGKPAVGILMFASSCGYSTNIYGYSIYKWLILTISSSWNRWLFQIYWLPKHGWPILLVRCANFGVDLISHSNWSFRRSFRWAWDIKESENLMKTYLKLMASGDVRLKSHPKYHTSKSQTPYIVAVTVS